MPKLFDVMAPAGKYTDAAGQEKTRWIRCGAVIKNQNGNTSLKLDCLPVGMTSDDGAGIWLSLFKPQENNGQQNQQAAPPAQQTAPPPAPPAQDDGW